MIIWLITLLYDRRRYERAERRELSQHPSSAPPPAPRRARSRGSAGKARGRPGQHEQLMPQAARQGCQCTCACHACESASNWRAESPASTLTPSLRGVPEKLLEHDEGVVYGAERDGLEHRGRGRVEEGKTRLQELEEDLLGKAWEASLTEMTC
ncbi:hypothetical protein IAT38_006602 [Cryptococcus sp. DSM 104549]